MRSLRTDIASQWRIDVCLLPDYTVKHFAIQTKSIEMLEHSIKLLVHYLKFRDVPVPYRQQRLLFKAIALFLNHTLIQQRRLFEPKATRVEQKSQSSCLYI